METHFCITVRLLDPRFHGRGDGGAPEWPPSPLRLFQSLVATASRLGGGSLRPEHHAALQWLEEQPPPHLVAPFCVPSLGYRLSVPNNAMDIVASAWARGNYSGVGDADPRTHRAMKMVRPLLLEQGGSVHYLWLDAHSSKAEPLCEIARSLVSLGWGVDLVVGHGQVMPSGRAETLEGNRWLPTTEGVGERLRVPVAGTLLELVRRYRAFLNRISSAGFVPPPALSAYRRVEYQMATEVPGRPLEAYALLRPDGSSLRTFDPVRRGLTVAGMLRHATKQAATAAGWAPPKVAQVVLGHRGEGSGPESVASGGPRLQYLPIPTIEFRTGGGIRVGPIRRCIVSAVGEQGDENIVWVRKNLSAADLVDQRSGDVTAILSLLPRSDGVIRRYLEPSSIWTSVTPVVLPGYDDPEHLLRKAERPGIAAVQRRRLIERVALRTEALLRKALVQAGLSDVVAHHVTFEWRQTGFLAGVDLASLYGVPNHLRRYPRVHVKLAFHNPRGKPMAVRGPLCVGGGRFYGIGLLVGLPGAGAQVGPREGRDERTHGRQQA